MPEPTLKPSTYFQEFIHFSIDYFSHIYTLLPNLERNPPSKKTTIIYKVLHIPC